MKIAPKAAAQFLVKPDAACRAVLLYGPDAGLVRERASLIKNTIFVGNDDPFAAVELSEPALLEDPARLADELSTISLMGGKRLILLRGVDDKTTKIIEAALPYFHDAVFMVAMADALSTRSSLRTLFEKEPAFAALACYKDEARDVEAVVRKAFADAGIALDRDGVAYLTEQLGNDRYVTRQEIEKIITYAGDDKAVSLEALRDLVDYNRDTNLDDMVNAVADKNLAAMEKTLTNMLREAVAPIAYLRALQRYFNRLYKMRAEMESGMSAEAVVQVARPPVFFRQAPIMTRHLQQWGIPQIAKALTLLVEAELAVKTSDIPPIPASTRKLMQVTQVR